MLHDHSSFYSQLLAGPLIPGKTGNVVGKKRLSRRSNTQDFRRADRQKACETQIERLPRKGHELVLILTGDWNGWDIVPSVLHLSRKKIRHLRIATLGFNDRQSVHLTELVNAGQIQAVSMLVSEMFAAKSTREFANLKHAMTGPGRKLGRSRNHAKLLLFELSNGTKYVAHGSLNLRTCRCFEQLVFANSPDLHDFFADYIDSQVRASNG